MAFPFFPEQATVSQASGLDRRTFLRLAASGAMFLGATAWGAGRLAFAAKPQDQGCSQGDPGSFTANPPGQAGSFLLFSDAHFDPFADPAKVKALAAAPAGEWRAILSDGAKAPFSPYGQDSNNALFQSFLDDMAGAAPRPDFLLYPGDLLCHRFWTQYPKLTGDLTPQGLLGFITKTAEYFLTEVTRRFPGVPLYLALGNNDSFEGDFALAPRSPYLSATAPLVAKLCLKDDAARAPFLKSYPQYGCYAAPLPGPGGARLVVYTDIFWAKRSPHQEAGKPVLEFLERELAQAKQQGQKVWLMAHMPPGDNTKASASKLLKKGKDVYKPLLLDAFNSALAALLVKYADTIRASFAGHVHRDEFRLVFPSPGALPAASMRLAPSISPVTGNNPGYQIFTYDRSSLELLDMSTRYLDLGAPDPAWALEYTYSRTYGRGLRAAKDWQEMYQELLTCPQRREAFSEGFDLRSAHIREVTERTFPLVWESLGLSASSPNALYQGTVLK